MAASAAPLSVRALAASTLERARRAHRRELSVELEQEAQMRAGFFGTQRPAVSAISPTSSYMMAPATIAVM